LQDRFFGFVLASVDELGGGPKGGDLAGVKRELDDMAYALATERGGDAEVDVV
jgi:hypothetical protein